MMDRYHEQLLDRTAYPDPTETVSFRETHISRVYLTDTMAYKLKKPLDLGFLDFSSLAKRKFYCQEEVRLNRRFSPGTYLGMTNLVKNDGQVRFFGEGDIVDYAVCMKRLPDDLMLDQMLERADPSLDERMSELAKTLNTVFRIAEPCIDTEHPNRSVVENNCRENLSQTKMAIDAELSESAHQLMSRVTENALERLRGLFERREAAGFVRDGHGDLHSGNICMTEPIQVYDCIEFNRRFRVADIASDLAFLLMDLDFRDRRDLGETLLNAYQKSAHDPDLETLLPFYKQYRAWVRGKVDAMLASERETTAETREQAHRMAVRYFNLALGYALQPTLLITTGLMGVGKTVHAQAFAKATGATVLRSDIIRKELVGLPPKTSSVDEYGKGLYAAEMTSKTYDELYRQCENLLAEGRTVVADASFADAEERGRFRDLAAQYDTGFCLLQIKCPDDVAMARLEDRSGDESDGRPALFQEQKKAYRPPGAWEEALIVDSSADLDYNVQSILCYLLAGQEHAS